MNSENLINHWNINWTQFKDPVSNMCLAGSVVASWSQPLSINWSQFKDPVSCWWYGSMVVIINFQIMNRKYWKLIALLHYNRRETTLLLLKFQTYFNKVGCNLRCKRVLRETLEITNMLVCEYYIHDNYH